MIIFIAVILLALIMTKNKNKDFINHHKWFIMLTNHLTITYLFILYKVIHFCQPIKAQSLYISVFHINRHSLSLGVDFCF